MINRYMIKAGKCVRAILPVAPSFNVHLSTGDNG